MICRSPVGNTPHICRTFKPVAMTLCLGSGSPLLRRRHGLAPRTASFGLCVRTLFPILMPESLASTVPPRLHICPILPRRASAARKKRMDKQLFSLSLIMILSKISMNVKQISRFYKIIWNGAYFFLLLSSIFSSCVFSPL